MHRHARKCLGQSGGGGGGGGGGEEGVGSREDVDDKNKILTLELTYGEEYRDVSRIAAFENS